MERKAEQARIAAERNADRVADLEARKLRDEEKRARQLALAAEWKQLRADAQAAREREQKELDELKVAKAREESAQLEKQRLQEKLKRESEIVEAGKYAKDRKASEKRLAEEREEKRKEEIALKEENFRNKKEFEKKARELAQSAVESDREAYEQQVRARLAKEYEEKREAIEAVELQKSEPIPTSGPTQFQLELAERYPVGVTEESEVKRNQEIKRLVVNRGDGYANQFSRVKWNWGGVYYFKNKQSTSQQIFELETAW
jgi:hypothetical protein